MFGIKTRLIKRLKNITYPTIQTRKFPLSGIPGYQIKTYINEVKRQLQRRDINQSMGWLYTLPHPRANETYSSLLNENPNNLGNWSFTKKRLTGTLEMERQVIHKFIDLYKGQGAHLEGYVTSGGTESNIFSAWMGRKYLAQFSPISRICLLKTSLAHYSIDKASDIVGVDCHTLPLNTTEWNIDTKSLTQTVGQLYQKGFRSFLLPLTLGYTLTGTSDNIQKTLFSIRSLQRTHPTIHFFVWIDAALNGLPIPFLVNAFHPFSNPLVQTLVVDVHKSGLAPYPAGIMLYRAPLRKLVEKPIDYLYVKDNTLLGSRSGIPAAAIWAMIHSLGKHGYRQLFQRQIRYKNLFIDSLARNAPKIKILTSPESLTCAIVLPDDLSLPNSILRMYDLHKSSSRL
ncbi:MAG: pyridoxal-dependent decarboxylase, partial [Patescibacteria group bacterium]|nr:pyridoxal-dependent decarboxylase [Patescibacteria group bacterium]